MRRPLGAMLVFAVLLLAAPALAQVTSSADAAAALAEANRAAAIGDWATVEATLAPLHRPGVSLSIADRAEVLRLSGLVAYFAGRLDQADADWLAYLRLDLDGRLDPATVPPEAVTYFETVRSRHGAELRALRPRPKPARRWWVLNLVPPVGQIQNGERDRALWIGGALVGTLAINLTTYGVLRSWCDERDRTCDGHERSAPTVRGINIAAGVAAITAYVLGVVDGVRGAGRARARAAVAAAVAASAAASAALPGGGGAIVVGDQF